MFEISTAGWVDVPCERSNWNYDEEGTGISNDGGECKSFTLPYMCVKAATPMTATGGHMAGCKGSQWAMGYSYGPAQLPQNTHLAATVSAAVYSDLVKARAVDISGEFVASPSECMSRVKSEHPNATAAEYSNTGSGGCKAVFEARGVVFDTQRQTCIFV